MSTVTNFFIRATQIHYREHCVHQSILINSEYSHTNCMGSKKGHTTQNYNIFIYCSKKGYGEIQLVKYFFKNTNKQYISIKDI